MIVITMDDSIVVLFIELINNVIFIGLQYLLIRSSFENNIKHPEVIIIQIDTENMFSPYNFLDRVF